MKNGVMWKIELEDLELECIIGILPFERERKQKICVNAEFLVESEYLVGSKPLTEGDFLDYRLLREHIVSAFAREFGLLEEAHNYFLETIPKSFPQIKEFWIKITKLEIFSDCKVSITSYYKE
ncbi:dihydroneopterin aldolase [Helicobacter sp.]|uniref:dihydroneopterin aldolase n=1 Tax=Helicobacter sp. TaxID=218 RepID=UPI0025B878E7|nr:dihydroneopterin aldolase [Helicobacter sp.]MCI5969308.1 dihydroneopterin aldolase [Helicobacter sp.]MDY2585562.1 dihydroneopterin aldolase [Helicobacter sp.]